MQLEDVCLERAFHDIIVKEDIDGEVHYLVDWAPTLVQGSVLQMAKAEPLISLLQSSVPGADREERDTRWVGLRYRMQSCSREKVQGHLSTQSEATAISTDGLFQSDFTPFLQRWRILIHNVQVFSLAVGWA